MGVSSSLYRWIAARDDITTGKRSGDSGSALLWNVVEANMKDGDSRGLTEGEVFSNIFSFLLAGHGTSAHTLCFAFMLLAFHPDCQQKLYDEVTCVWPDDLPITQLTTGHNEHMEKLKYTMACLRETLRVFPAEPRLTKHVHVHVVLPSTSFAVGPGDILVETGKFTVAILAGSALYWGQDAAEFKPERFIDTESYQWPRHAYLPFSLGARSCIGQRFAFAEMIAILASVVRRYRILVADELANRPLEVQEETMFKWTTDMALTPVNACVKFCRRV